MTAPPVFQHRVFGEGAPKWLIAGLAVLGAMSSMLTAVLLIPALPDTLQSRIDAIWTDLGAGQVSLKDIPPPEPSPARLGDSPLAGPQASSSSDTRTQPEAPPAAEEDTPEPDGWRAPELKDLRRLAERVAQKPLTAKAVGEHEVAMNVPSSTPDDVSALEAERQTMMQTAGIKSGERPSEDDKDTCAPVFSIRFRRGGVQPLGANVTAKTARLAQWLRARPEAKVYVEGHTDSVGPEEFNLLLSYRRANAVVDRLVEAGIARNQLSIRAHGETQPLEPVKESGQNRRVVLSIDDAPACVEKSVEQ